MKKKLSFTIASLFAIGILFATSVLVFKNLGRWLVVSDPLPEKLDAVFVFAWDLRRVKHAVRLSEKYPGALLIFSDPYKNHFTRPAGNYYKKYLKNLNIDTTRVVSLTGCRNTFGEVKILYRYIYKSDSIKDRIGYTGSSVANFKTDKIKLIGFVSSPLHMRRIKMSVNRVFGSKDIKSYMLHAPLSDFGYDEKFFKKWWKEKNNKVIIEWFKIVLYWFFKR